MRRLALLLAFAASASAQTPDAAQTADSTQALAEVTVGEAARERLDASVVRVPIAGVLARDPVRLADVARLVPSATASTNSRGETLLVVRGGGDRETAVLLDGAPLAMPWDRRLDAGLVPAGVVGSLRAVRGPASLAWGPNTSGGALDLAPRTAPGTDVEASGGWPWRGRLAATHVRRVEAWTLAASVDASAQQGDALAAPLPFSQAGALRTNTDQALASGLARAAYAGRVDASLTVLHVEAARGIAPEGHLDPATDRVRFWRRPDASQTLAVARLRSPLPRAGLDATLWAGRADARLVQYRSARYATAEASETTDDRTVGARLRLETAGARGTLRGIVTGHLASRRRVEAAQETFREAGGRLAVEAEATVGATRLLAGLGFDAFVPTETAGRASAGAARGLAAVVRAERDTGALRLHAGASRAVRFPTMRELFGGALGRFVLNPALRPETTWQGDAGLAASRPRSTARAAAFVRHTVDALDQAVLADGRRQRVNLGGSRAVGVEAEAAWRLGAATRLDASATVLHLRGWTDAARGLRLPERPAALGRLALSHLPPQGWTATVEALATGPAVSLGLDGMIELPASLRLGARAGYRWRLGQGLAGVFARVDNATDALHLPQAGLPAPGREVRVGLRVLG